MHSNIAQAGDITNDFLSPALRSLPGTTFLSNTLSALLTLAFVVGAIAFLFMLITGGIKWMSSSGDKGKLESARERVSNALVGVFILLAFFLIVNFIGCFFGVSFLSLKIGELNIAGGDSPICRVAPGKGGGGTGGGGDIPEEPPPPLPPVGDSCNGTIGTANLNCQCGGPATGKCAKTNQCAKYDLGPTADCYLCTAGGWSLVVDGSCVEGKFTYSCSTCP